MTHSDCVSQISISICHECGQVGLNSEHAESEEQGACTAGVVMFIPGSSILISPSATGDLYWIHGNGFSTLHFHQLVTMGCVLVAG